MRGFINIHVYEENNLIKIRFSSVSKAEALATLLPVDLAYHSEKNSAYISLREHSFLNEIYDQLRYFDKQEISQAFTGFIEPSIAFRVNYKKQLLTYSAIVYTLSTHAPLAINWLMCLSLYINHIKLETDAIQFRSDFAENLVDSEDKKSKVFLGDISDFLSKAEHTGFNSMQVLLHQLSIVDRAPQYDLTLSAVTRLFERYRACRESGNINDKKPLIHFLNAQDQMAIFGLDSRCIDKKQDALYFIKEMIHELICENNTELLNNKKRIICMINFLDFLVRKNLFESCLNRNTFAEGEFDWNSGKYHWESVEWLFLKHATFALNKKGQLEIINIKNNYAYQYLLRHEPCSSVNSLVLIEQKYLASLLRKSLGLEEHHAFKITNGRMEIIDTRTNPIESQFDEVLYETAVDEHCNEVFAKRIQWLLEKTLKLGVAQGSDFCQKIVFSPESSELLKEKGFLFFNQMNLKKELYVNNNLMFFSRSTSNTAATTITHLPTEIQEHILAQLF